MKPHNYHILLFFAFLISVFSIQCTSTRPIPTPIKETKGFELREGVVIDSGRNLMYIMNTEGSIDAIELSKGEKIWGNNQAAKPLMIIDNLLVCQAESHDLQNKMGIVVLNVQKRGSFVYSDSIVLPEIVQVSIDETLESRFRTKTKVWKNEIYVFWNYLFQEQEGFAPPDSIPQLTKSAKGIVLINPSSQTILSQKDNETPSDLLGASINQYGLAPFTHPSEIQFPSADNAHFLKSKRIADDRTWEKYLWAIHESSSEKLIASITNHISYTPYFVSGTSVIFTTNPFYRVGNPREPRKI